MLNNLEKILARNSKSGRANFPIFQHLADFRKFVFLKLYGYLQNIQEKL